MKVQWKIFSPLRSDRYSHYYDEMCRNVYVASYMNFGSFVCGMIGGMVHKRWRNDCKKFVKNRILQILWYSMIPTALILLMSAFIFYENDFVKPAIWIAIYAALIRNLWGFFLAALVTGMAFGFGCKWMTHREIVYSQFISIVHTLGIIKDAMSYPIFRPLGRLTFCAYLIHPAIIRLCTGNLREPLHASDETILVQVFSVFTLSYIAALLLCLGLELPTSALQKHFSTKKTENRMFFWV